MKNQSAIALPARLYPLFVAASAATASIDNPAPVVIIDEDSFPPKPVPPQALFRVHGMVGDTGNWDQDWFNSYE